MVKRREDGQIGIFSFCLPVDIFSATGCCQNCWSHAKTQRQDRRSTFPAIQLGAFAPLREVKTGIDEPVQNGLIGIISFCLPVSLTPFHHPRAKLLLSLIPATTAKPIPAAPSKRLQSLTARSSVRRLNMRSAAIQATRSYQTINTPRTLQSTSAQIRIRASQFPPAG